MREERLQLGELQAILNRLCIRLNPTVFAVWDNTLSLLAAQKDYDEMFSTHQNFSKEQISLETEEFLPHSMDLSRQTFEKFIGLFSLKQKPIRLGSR